LGGGICLRLTAGLSAERPSLGGLFGPARASMLIAALPTYASPNNLFTLSRLRRHGISRKRENTDV